MGRERLKKEGKGDSVEEEEGIGRLGGRSLEGGGEFLALPCGQPSQVSQSQQQCSVVFLDSTNTATNRGGSWKFNRGVAATVEKRVEEEVGRK